LFTTIQSWDSAITEKSTTTWRLIVIFYAAIKKPEARERTSGDDETKSVLMTRICSGDAFYGGSASCAFCVCAY
jgi:hypothetical protein